MASYFIVRITTDYIGKSKPGVAIVAFGDDGYSAYYCDPAAGSWPSKVPPAYYAIIDAFLSKHANPDRHRRKDVRTAAQWRRIFSLAPRCMSFSGPFSMGGDSFDVSRQAYSMHVGTSA